MAHNTNDQDTGPHGTQAFSASEVNLMIAEEIIKAQSDKASIPSLIGLSGDRVGEIIHLKEDKVTIGRHKRNTIQLPMPGVSSDHAYIRKTTDGMKLMNLLSSNGTYVNGDKVTESLLSAGDRVAFSEAEFIYALTDPVNKVSDGSGGSVTIRWVVIALILLAIIFGLIAFLYQ